MVFLIALILYSLFFGNQGFIYRGEFHRYFSNYRKCSRYVSQCVELPQCPPIAWDLYHADSLALALIILKDNMCGVNRGMLKVCCLKDFVILDPHDNTELTPEMEMPTTKTYYSGQNPSTTFRPSWTSIRSHPNFKLINRNCGSGIVDRITGGEAAIPGEFPWMAILQYNVSGQWRFLCGGSLITDMYVLTAAHCLTFRSDSTKLIAVRLGEYDVSSEDDCADASNNLQCAERPRDFLISELIIHPQYNKEDRRQYTNDIALIRLQERANLSDYITPVCLPVPDEITTKDEALGRLNLTVAGWGMTENSTESNILLKANVPYVDPKTCRSNLRGRQIHPGQFCAGGADMDACNGDSGGPLVAKLFNSDTPICYQVGIVSIGLGSCFSSTPSIYTNVEDFLPWILDNIRD